MKKNLFHGLSIREKELLNRILLWRNVPNAWSHWAMYVQGESKKFQKMVKEILTEQNNTDAP